MWNVWHLTLTSHQPHSADIRQMWPQGPGKWLAVLYYRTWGQHFISRSKVLRKTLAYITCAIRQTYFTQPKGREAPVKKWRKYWERGLSWPCYSLRGVFLRGAEWGAGNVRCGESWSERPAHKAHTVHLFMLFMSCIPLPIVSIDSSAQLSPNIGFGMSGTLWLWPHSNSNQLL